MIDLFQDRRIFANSKKRPILKNVLPQIKYSPTISKKLNDDLLLINPNSRLLYNYQPLSNILISKKICPPTPDQMTLLVSKKRPTQNINMHNFKIRRESVKKVTDNQKEQDQESPLRLNSTSLSRRSHMSHHKEVPQQLSHQHEELKVVKATNQPTFLIVRGNNNEDLVREILLERKIWKQLKSGQGVPNFKWIFYKQKHNYKKMWSFNKKRIINHFEYNEQISTKDQLIKNLQIYCETKKIEVFSITPITFILDFDDEYCEYNLKQFVNFFQKNDPRKNSKKNWPFSLIGKMQNYMACQNPDIKKKVNILSKPLNSSTYYSENSYLWFLKPTGLNRGRGIEIFDSLEDLQRILLEYLSMMNRKEMKKKIEKNDKHDKTIDKETKEHEKMGHSKQVSQGQTSPSSESKFVGQKFKLNTCSFVLQKYVQKPLLIHQRKFDIRAWVLLTDDLNVYFFKQAYIRTSAQTFSTQNIDNYFIHLTNNAIQKHSQNYGAFQNGNQLPFSQLDQFIPENDVKQIWNRIKEVTYMTFSSVKKKINSTQRKFCFQLFGMDFIIDSELKVWLIQVNQNPCLECSSPLLGQVIPRMLSDAFKLTLDKIIDRKPEQKAYPVDGYQDAQNLWQNLGQLVPNSEYSPLKKK